MSKDMEEMIKEAPQLTLTPFDQTEGVKEGNGSAKRMNNNSDSAGSGAYAGGRTACF